MDIVKAALSMIAAVERFVQEIRVFFYSVTLLGYSCLKCNGSLSMIEEGKCRCNSCRYEFDPTVAFQRCSSCGGSPKLGIRRYKCKKCGGDIVSKFLFDGLVFTRISQINVYI